MRLFSALLILACCLFAAACDPLDTTVCTSILVPGLQVEVRDAATGDPAEGVMGLAIDGAFVDTLEGDLTREPPILSGAHERAGTYEVVVSGAGYKTWRQRGVKVGRDECHVRTVRLQARLDAE